MKINAPLSPAIEEIERRLLGVSDGLIEAVMRGETSPGIADAVRQSPEWDAYQVCIDHQHEETQQSAADNQSLAMPDHVRDYIRRRVATRSLATMSRPAPGRIVLIEKLVTPRAGQMDAIMTAPLYILLDGPTEAPALWHGWLVAGETEYASWWDFVLQEEDAPFDPEAAMVQLWNPVHLYLPMAGKVVGCLAPHRLQAVRSLAADFVTSETPTDLPVWPGRVAMRMTTSGLPVATGSPLGDQLDPRRRYQDVYFEAAEAIREPARLALAEVVPQTSFMESLRLRLATAASELGQQLVPVPRVVHAMAEGDSEEPDLLWQDLARIRFIGLDATTGQIAIQAIGEQAIACRLLQAGVLYDKRTATPEAEPVVFSWEIGRATTLSLQASDGRALSLPLDE